MILVMGIIFIFSAQPGDSLHLPPLPGIDKVAHAAVYGALAASTIFAFNARYKEEKSRVVMVATVLFCFCYALSDEFHQSFVPGRSPSGLDVLADVCGALIICLLWARMWKNQNKTIMNF
jgi:VanZ family protein